MFPHSLGHLRTWSLIDVTVWGSLSGAALARGSISVRVEFEFKNPHLLLVCYLCFKLAVQDGSSQLPSPTTMPATCYHAVLVIVNLNPLEIEVKSFLK